MSPNDKKLNAREALLDAAKRLFTEKGYEAVSTRELAEAAEVNLGAIQYHFGSKAKLFVETVRHVMAGNECERAHSAIQEPISSKEDAAFKLAQFVGGFLHYLLHGEEPRPCRMMVREIFTGTSRDPEMFEALTSAMANDFMKPVDDALREVFRYLVPGASREELGRHVNSVVGQCAFYLTHGPFLTRLCGKEMSCEVEFALTARHIATFSLRAARCAEDLIEAVVEKAIPLPKEA